MKTYSIVTLVLAAGTALYAADPSPSNSHLPVKEVTAFKDGHAFVVHEGAMPVDASGQVVLDYLPEAVIGTFWAYSAEAKTKLVSVLAGQRQLVRQRTALTLRELLEANTGAEVFITETNAVAYPATILGFPTRTTQELAATSPPHTRERLPQPGELVMLQTANGTKAVLIHRIQDVTFKLAPKTKTAQTEFRDFLTLNFDWGKRAPDSTVNIGLVYLQKGIRWIPSYRVDLDGRGQARIKLQATVLNEMIDLVDANLHLVIGVPTFSFKDTLDPMALQETATQLSAYFYRDIQSRNRVNALASNFSNAIMTQAVRMGEYRGGTESGSGDPELPAGARNEDLFVFTVPHLTLKKGERMVLPLAEFSLPYTDVFVLDLPFAPPPEMARSLNNQQQAELARLFTAPTVMHQARLINQSEYPLTTAPALILREGRVIAQGMMTYTAVGASTDLGLTTAVDLQVKKTDSETQRAPNAFQHHGDQYLRVDLQGAVRLTNHREQAVKIEVTRHVLGHVDSADHDGKAEMSNVFESRDFLPTGDYSMGPYYWWNWFSWPWWWHQVNGVGQVTWSVAIEKGASVDLGYTWHYYWR